MAKYKVLKKFRGIKEKRVFEPKDEIDITVKRGDEIEEKLGKGFIERLDKTEEK